MADSEKPKSSKKDEPEGFFKKVQGQLTGLAQSSGEVPLKLIAKSFGEDGLLRSFYINPLDPDRLQAMAEAGHFLKDARELAGLSVNDLSVAIGVKDKDLLYEVERGETTLSLDLIFRVASLLARHDPIPFILKFLRTYSPAVDNAMEKLGVAVIPKQIERERRFTNIYRKHDKVRQLSDEEYDRFYEYVESTTDFIVGVLETERSIAHRKQAELEAALEASIEAKLQKAFDKKLEQLAKQHEADLRRIAAETEQVQLQKFKARDRKRLQKHKAQIELLKNQQQDPSVIRDDTVLEKGYSAPMPKNQSQAPAKKAPAKKAAIKKKATVKKPAVNRQSD